MHQSRSKKCRGWWPKGPQQSIQRTTAARFETKTDSKVVARPEYFLDASLNSPIVLQNRRHRLFRHEFRSRDGRYKSDVLSEVRFAHECPSLFRLWIARCAKSK